jgi:hypothetical protein
MSMATTTGSMGMSSGASGAAATSTGAALAVDVNKFAAGGYAVLGAGILGIFL